MSVTTLGPCCEGLGLNTQNFLQHLTILCNNDVNQLQAGHACEIFQHVRKEKIPWSKIIACFPLSVQCSVSVQMFVRPFSAVNKRWQEIRKRGRFSEAAKAFMKEPFGPRLAQLSKSSSCEKLRGSSSVESRPPKQAGFNTIAEEVVNRTSEKLRQDLNRLQSRNALLEKENKKLAAENKKLKRQNSELRSKYCPKRVNWMKKMKSRSAAEWRGKYYEWRDKYHELQQKTDQANRIEKELQIAKKNIKNLKTSKDRMKSRHKTNICKVQEKTIDSYVHELFKQDQVIKEANQKIGLLHNKVSLELEAREASMSGIPTKDLGPTARAYSSGIREASYALQTAGVAQQNVSATLENVVHAVTGQKLVGRVPSYGTQNRFVKEMKALSRQQVKEALGSTSQNTLKYDGTTKSIGHLVETEVATKDNTYLVGIAAQAGGTAAEYVGTITDSLKAVGETPCPTIPNSKPTDLLSTICNTMTDRCATNLAVDRQLEALVGRNLNKFRCALHPLDAIAHANEKVVRTSELELGVNEAKKKGLAYPFSSRGSSNTEALIRCAGKLFYHPGHGCGQELQVFLRSKGVMVPSQIQGVQLDIFPRYVGNRFHIFFLCAGILYHLKEPIVEYLTEVHPPTNAMQMSVLNALQLPQIQMYLRALGLVGKVLTGPWMRLIGKELNILEMNGHFDTALMKLREWAADATPLLTEPVSAFEGVPVAHDDILASLVTGRGAAGDEQTQTVLQQLFAASIAVMERQLSTQLPGGLFWNPSQQLVEQAKSCSASNVSGERHFGLVDYQLQHARHATVGHVESKTMYKANLTGQWLASQTNKEQRIALAKKEAAVIARKDKEKMTTVQEKILKKLQEARKRLQAKQDVNREKSEKLLEDMYSCGGLWESVEDKAEHMPAKTSVTKKKTLLKCQINVRTKLLKCVVQLKPLLTKASVEELEEYLSALCATPVPSESRDLYNYLCTPDLLLGVDFTQNWKTEMGTDNWEEGHVAQVKEDSGEFKLEFQSGKFCFMTKEELLVDFMNKDLVLF